MQGSDRSDIVSSTSRPKPDSTRGGSTALACGGMLPPEADANDDSVEMVVRTPTTSEDRTIEEYRSEFVDDYEVVGRRPLDEDQRADDRAAAFANVVPAV